MDILCFMMKEKRQYLICLLNEMKHTFLFMEVTNYEYEYEAVGFFNGSMSCR